MDRLSPLGVNVMDGQLRTWRRGLLGLFLILPACAPTTPVEQLPTCDATIASAGKRLSGIRSVADLTTMATHGDQVLAALTRTERDALARGYVRFEVDRSINVFIATERGSEPFWLEELGFQPVDMTLTSEGAIWSVHQKAYGPGWVGLGVNGLDQSASAHYAVFVKPKGVVPVAIQIAEPAGWETLPATNLVSLERGVEQPIEVLPTILAGSTLLRCNHDRRHSTMLARGQVWKTHVVSSRTPDQVVVSFGADPMRELTWSWRTAPGSGGSVVRCRVVGASKTNEYQGVSEALTIPELLNDPTMIRHTVRVAGLSPGTTYEYMLGDGTSAGMSAWKSVRTAPGTNSDVTLLYMGDPQCGLEKWGKLLTDAHRRHPHASALLIAGDLVDRGNERTNWDHFFMRAAAVFDRLPLMPAIGNHEYLDRGPWLYTSFFALPENGPVGIKPDLVYHYEIGDTFVAVLDSELAGTDPKLARQQAEWLDARLSETERTWKLVMYHHPAYASHIDRENPEVQRAWVPVFDKHHVDLVLQGHDHAYMRTYPMKGGVAVASPKEGTVYVVAVSGDKYYDQNTRGNAEIGYTNLSTYQTIEIQAGNSRLVYKSFDAAGREVDAFTIQKSRGPEAVAEREFKRPSADRHVGLE